MHQLLTFHQESLPLLQRVAMANILIVEPNRFVQQFLVPLLERGGYSVCVVSSGAEARWVIGQHSHDLILLSAALPALMACVHERIMLASGRLQGVEPPVRPSRLRLVGFMRTR